jgi:hypothetical protein
MAVGAYLCQFESSIICFKKYTLTMQIKSARLGGDSNHLRFWRRAPVPPFSPGINVVISKKMYAKKLSILPQNAALCDKIDPKHFFS